MDIVRADDIAMDIVCADNPRLEIAACGTGGAYSRTEWGAEFLFAEGIGRSNVMVTQAANDG